MNGRDNRSFIAKGIYIFPLLLLASIAFGTAGYVLIEGMTPLEALYMTVITVSTIGYREVRPPTTAGMWFTMALIVVGVGSAAATFTMVLAAIAEGHLRRVLGRRQVEKTIATLSGHTIVCGFGRMGQMVAEELTRAGRKVVVIELDEERLVDAARNLLYVRGDAQDEQVLHRAGILRAACLASCLPTDADNVFLTLTARQLSAELKIVSRAEQLTTQSKLLHAGATQVVCPDIIGATRIANVILRPAVVDFFDVANKGVDLEMDQLLVAMGSELAGRTLRELSLPMRTGAIVVAVRSVDGLTIYNPRPDLSLVVGDTLILVGQRGCSEAVQKIQRGEGNTAAPQSAQEPPIA